MKIHERIVLSLPTTSCGRIVDDDVDVDDVVDDDDADVVDEA